MDTKTKVRVKLAGEDGNAFSIIARVRKALRQNGYDKDFIDEYVRKATSGDFDNLLAVTCEYVEAY